MNKVELMGRFTKDPEVTIAGNGTAKCSFTLAVDRRFKDNNGARQSDFINCVAWKQHAAFISKNFTKGNKVVVIGSLRTRSYDKDGHKYFVTEVLVEETYFCESKKKDGDMSVDADNIDLEISEFEMDPELPFDDGLEP